MYEDPYKVLGVSRDADMEEIRKAYRDLAKRYHPDVNRDDPDAGEKMSRINAAYDAIRRGQTDGGDAQQDAYTAYRQYDRQTYGGFEGDRAYDTAAEDDRLRAVRSYLEAGYYDEAMYLLSRIQLRTARWYYYASRAQAGQGNVLMAAQYAQQAADMDPNNELYRTWLARIVQPGMQYERAAGQHGFPLAGMGMLCQPLCIGLMLCNICGGMRMMPWIFCI